MNTPEDLGGHEKPHCIILRGVPGAGKSQVAYELVMADDFTLCRADDFFVQPDGGWVFDPTNLPQAHAECLLSFVGALCDELDVVVDNTNISPVEIAPYYALALAYGYEVEIIEIGSPAEFDTYWMRQTHGVPEHVFARMCAGFIDRSGFAPWWRWRKSR